MPVQDEHSALADLWLILRRAHRGFWRWYRGLYRKAPWWRKVITTLVSAVVMTILYLIAVNINFLWLFGKSPSISDVAQHRTNVASIIYSADGEQIGKFFKENRTQVGYSEVSPEFFTALVDTEDERFYSHHGVDFKGVFSAIKDLIVSGRVRGASTITQQLAKNMFRVRSSYSTGLLGKIPGFKMLIMKSKEWILAFEIEIKFSKEEILEMYANTVDFGSNAFGINTASKTYFNVLPADLTVEQCATLVGLLKATTAYNPRLNPENSLKRRNVVLSNMLNHNHLTTAQYDSICALPLRLDYSVEKAYDGKALYFRDAVVRELSNWCEDHDVDLYSDGLKIYTTLNMGMQRYAEQAVSEKMKSLQETFNSHWEGMDCWVDDNGKVIADFVDNIARKTDTYRYLVARYPLDLDSVEYYMHKPHKVKLFDYTGGHEAIMSSIDSVRYMLRFLHTGFVAMEPHTGKVLAWVGDIDFGTWKHDNVTASHQPGSTFKTFVYTTAMVKGLTPCDRRRDAYISLPVWDETTRQMRNWTPHNANGTFHNADVTLRAAFAQSINSVAVRLGEEVGIDSIIFIAKQMGINSDLARQPALTLGASDVTLLELVNAYGTIANGGVVRPPVLVERIEDRNGNEIYHAEHDDYQAIPRRAAYLMQQMLKACRTDAGGTSMTFNQYITAPLSDTDFGGKTGTSNSHADAWWVGISPRIVCGAWVGGEYRQIHFRTGALGQGSHTALPICGRFYERVLSDERYKQYHGRFEAPPEVIANGTFFSDCQ